MLPVAHVLPLESRCTMVEAVPRVLEYPTLPVMVLDDPNVARLPDTPPETVTAHWSGDRVVAVKPT